MKTLQTLLYRLLGRLQRDALAHKYISAEPPLRAELFSADQMERHGKTLAEQHQTAPQHGPDKLLARLVDNESILVGIFSMLTEAAKAGERITPAGEWLLDNFYLVEEQIRIARKHFPKGYSRELPLLGNGPSQGLPRVYDIALESVAHGDGRVDPESLNRFVAAYQTIDELRLGELWAIPIMLRLALIENLRRVGSRVVAGMIDRRRADAWADQMIEVAEKDPKSLILVISDMARSNPPLRNSFVAELARRLQGQSSALALPLTWIEQRLSEAATTIEQMVQSETQSQASHQVSISHSIGSLRALGATDWREFVETMSAVERELRRDRDGLYAGMDFASRDRYRHVIEHVARHSRCAESEVARDAIRLAAEAMPTTPAEDSMPAALGDKIDPRRGHVGYYLIGAGLPQLEQLTGARLAFGERVRRLAARRPLLLYLGAIALLSAACTGGFLAIAAASAAALWVQALIFVPALLASSQLAVTLVNWLVTLLATPLPLPRMDYSLGIPAQSRTLVVVPTMLVSLQGVDDLVEALEVRFLANRDARLHFGLLTDFGDAASELQPEDDALLQAAGERVAALNAKYDCVDGDTFFLFHRPRRWNASEIIWMGYERKRGKLGDLNALLRSGADSTAFSLIVGATAILGEVRYVITLDTDTQLPRDCARALAGAMAHPLNRPCLDPASRLVTAGYGILQPRMAVNLPSTNRSRYAGLSGADAGIDPYTRAISDVYQDLFHEGSFIGKGIYDVDAFEGAVKERFPDNRILSHDLLEGCYARAGLLSDVQLYEDTPARYCDDVSRRHRWIRGDWQIASWLLSLVPAPAGQRRQNPLSTLSQWKLFDNLRRSLVPAAVCLLFLLGWILVPSVLAWTLAVLGILFLPLALNAGRELLNKQPDVLLGAHFSGALRSAGRQFAQAAFALACLPYEAWYSLDAIVRTATRLVSRRRMLEWRPSHDLQSGCGNDAGEGIGALAGSYRRMWPAPLLAVVCVLATPPLPPLALLVLAPLLTLWLGAPAIAWWLSRPTVRHASSLRPEQTLFLYKLARKTWRYFETFVNAMEHWLPPDNYQEQPLAVIAHRTSPTNMGLALLANLSAYDFGYITAGKLLERSRNTLQTMLRLERYQSHFYNWYDTLTLRPLSPLYVSSVDSGNLSGHLLTLRPGLLELADRKILGTRTFPGLRDTLAVLSDCTGSGLPELTRLQQEIEQACAVAPATLQEAQHCLERLTAAAALIAERLDAGSNAGPEQQKHEERGSWADALHRQCQEALDELRFLAPWIQMVNAPGDGKTALDEALRRIDALSALPTLRELAMLEDTLAEILDADLYARMQPQQRAWLAEFRPLVALASLRAGERLTTLEELARLSGELAAVDNGLLYDNGRHLMALGFKVEQRLRDKGNYDLLASEARLSSFVAIAQGAVPQESWFALGRMLTTVPGGDPILLSWSGSMFEYLMPMLVMPSYENTLLDQTCRAAVQRQIAYGKQRGVPWGISESGYNTVDAALNYQYRAFGVPGLGLKRGLAEDLVIAPYASALALMVMPEEACANLQRLTEDGLQGHYGMYEALDFTPSRVPRGQTSAIVRSFMAHHQGMSLLSFAYLLLGQPMQKRFESDPLFQATTLLLQERIPAAAAFHFQTAELADLRITSIGEMPMRVLHTADTPTPEVQLLSNGRYHVMVSNAGGGYSRWKDFAVTRWREDATCDHWGSFCYLRDPASGAYWSSAHQPTRVRADTYEAIFSESRAEFRRLDHAFETHTEIVVSPEDDIELRRMRITNRSDKTRMIEVTSYAEVVLTSSAADALHPAFSNLFVQSEILADRHAILCTRRPRSADEKMPWMFHLLAVHGAEAGSFSYETDRMRFIGRTRDVGAPQAMQDSRPLSGSQGAVLDPVVAIRTSIRLGANETATVDLVCGIGETREAALELVGKYRDRHLAGRVFDLACTHSWVNLQQINASEADAQLYSQLAGSVIYASAALRADATVLARNRRGQSGLWAYAVSGDLPIVLLQIGDLANIELVRQLVQAHTYWRQKGLIVDLVIWNEDHAGYRQVLQEQIMGLIASVGANLSDRPGGIFVRAAEQISVEDRTLFQTVARAIITDSSGTLAEQMNRRSLQNTRLARIPRLVPRRTGTLSPHRLAAPHAPADALRFFNGLGGFSANGREYVISTTQAQASPRVTPAPWVNVIANARFGTVISESGASYTWSENAHEFRFTPWGDDPVSDVSGEAIYLRDEESGAFWSPTALPCGGEAPYRTRHGFGYSIFEHEEDGIVSQLTVHVDSEASVKFSELTLLNRSGRTRRLSATGYVEWVLGDLRPKSAMHIVSEIDADSGALCARNRYSGEFADRIAFFDADSATRGENVSFTADRNEFLGRNGTLRQPAAMARSRLSNKLGAGLDPCAAMQVPFTLADGQSRQIIFRLGAAGGRRAADARDLMQRLRGPEAAKLSLNRVHAYWAKALGAVEVTTPDPALDLLANGWLLYQTIACRLWARSGYYQSGGAFGFRDQLQDTMALVHTQPQLLRQQVLSCAGRQFSAGDVQHWWHPPSGRGVRTHCSDDYLWLAQATCRYVRASGDLGVLDESAQFLEGRALNPEEDSYYDLPGHADSSASLYQHCVRAIEHGLNFGKHGLPLMGSGDWNDGMNLVGIKGRGESVWLGFFLYDTLLRFADLAQAYGDETFAERCRTEAVQLRRNIDKHAWDGGWYRRAWFDDGSRLGSAGNSECRIDSIAQSWSVLSGAGSKARSRTAMAALDAHLVRREHALVQLLDPPFDKATLNPGYIKGYVPGVRENGGQYTHAAIWASMAFAALGDRQRAWELFDMINPLRHGDSAAAIATYKVEPYVMAADVYFVAPHIGRGGWTWYTGSAGWMYRLIVESLLGIELVAGKLRFAPCLPADWSGYTLSYRYGESRYLIIIEQAALGEGRSISVSLDGLRQADADLTLVDDQREHRVEVRLPSRAAGNPPAAAATLS
ncbi:GH36-type glycosyl hydrolase domain-containing protein [Rhodocyclus tenuis]|uniref:Cellobiose phosphorylase n=1 Tax=Rhodocyclus tenuis TaxID=1066 RepID=A0A840G034_RHOTE|nr:glucoamylase family protein [Rhodocyclus tenuis]MBB4247514.1 cellobiose phosphorylase [Rhodocyclus tenuis]